MKGDTMKVNAISSIEKHVKSNKLAGFPTTYNEAISSLLGQSDKDYIMLAKKEVRKASKSNKLPADFVERAKKFFSNVFG